MWKWDFAATVFGQNLKLEPLKPEKKVMWRREMNCLLSLCDYIVEFAPTTQYLADGTVVEVRFRKQSLLCFRMLYGFLDRPMQQKISR